MADPSSVAPLPGPGGFVQPNVSSTGLFSPTPSLASSAPAASRTGGGLPQPRRHPLPPGSAKEDLVRRYVSDCILHINRRFVKRFATAPSDDPADDDIAGYRSMGELCRDVDALLNNLWKSGTPSLQVQYLLNIASELIKWMDGFRPSPRATLALLRKLDYCFASLLSGEDLETKDLLPGFEGGLRAGLSRTDMVRCRSIAEESRVVVVDVFRRGSPEPLDEAGARTRTRNYHSRPRPAPSRYEREGTAGTEATVQTETTAATEATTLTEDTITTDDDYDNVDFGDNDDDDDNDDTNLDVQMGVARVYEFTLVKLGEVLDDGCGSRIGIPGPSIAFEDENDDEY